MPKHRNSVVVAGWRYCFAVGERPFFAICLRDLADFRFVQLRSGLLKRDKAFSPIIPSTGLDAQVVIKIAEMNRGSLSECHFRRDFAIATIAEALAVLLEELPKLSLGHAKVRCAKALPNLFAEAVNSGIIPPGLMANEILEPRFLPCFGCHFLLGVWP